MTLRRAFMSKKKTLAFQTVLAWLATEVMFGRAHFAITRGLGRAAPVVSDIAPRFFALTRDAHATAAQLAVARIFDQTGAASIHTLLSSALNEARNFKNGTAIEVQKVIDEAKAVVAGLGPIVAAVRTRRNQTIAHQDARPFVDPDKYIKAGMVSYSEIERLFEQTGVILNKFCLLYRGVPVVLDLEDAKDYEQALDLIASAIRTRG